MVLNRNIILIADDESALRLGLARCIFNAGFTPVLAVDGMETLRLVKEHRPGLVILDVMMRGLSGLEVCRILKNDPETKDIKILFLSARGQKKEREEGLEAGGDYYMTKPFDYRELIKTVKDLIQDK